MEGRPERIADYFVVVGVGDASVSRFEQFSKDEEVVLPDRPTVQEPITDIAVFYSKHEQLPKGYKIIETTPSGHSANLNGGSIFSNGPIYICYKKGKDKLPIVDIGVFHSNQNQSPPVGHETLAFSIGGRSADLNKSGRSQSFLTLKRGLVKTHNNAITDLCVVASNKNEEPPSCFKLLRSLDLYKGLVGHTLHLCYRTSQVRPPAVAYTPELLSRYPREDHPEFPLPHSVPLFCLPFGVSIERWERHTPYPFPTFSTFALTNAQGQCMYGAVVVFYETVVSHKCAKEMKKELNIPEEEPLHISKCICLLSHWPFFSSFKAFLSALYRLSISHNSPLPLERFVGNLMLEVPFPTLVRPRIQMHIGSESIIFSLPVQTPLPLSVSTHWSLLSSLDPDNCLTLLSLTLLEQKLVLHSSRPALLTCVGEALRSVLFPFSWQCTYIPLCPLAFSSYMQAPVPFIIGIDSQFFDVFEKPPGVVVVDLDANSITMSKEVQELLSKHPLPARPSKTLRHALNALRPRVNGLDSGLDLAVEISHIDYKATHKHDLEVLDVEIREAFLKFFATIIGHYRKCLTPLLSAPSERSRDISHLFNQQLFLKHCSSSSEWPFFRLFFDTQVFNAFIEQRSFAHSESTFLVFFDECTEKVKSHPNSKLVSAVASISRRSDLPTVVSLPPDDSGLPVDKTYSYPLFPTSLDPALFNPRPPLDSPIQPNPSPSKPQPTSNSPIVAKRTAAEKTKDRENMEKALKSDSLWSKCLLSHVCSLWYVLLPSHLSTHWNKMDVLSQAMELLEDMRINKALPNDEVCYRILMQQCVNLGRPALAVRVYHEMRKAGIQPNAVTYGFYNKSVIEGAWPSQKRKWKVLLIVVSACLFLNNLKKRKRSLDKSEDVFMEADFSLIARSGSFSSRKSISALDVGLDEGKGEGQGQTNLLQRGVPHKGTIFKLSSGSMAGGDYMMCGDSSYTATHTRGQHEGSAGIDRGLWSNVTVTGVQSPVKRHRYTRTDPPTDSTSSSLSVELSTCTQCPSCQSLIYDEQIMSGWSGDEGNYKTTCPYCSSQLVAFLTVTTKHTTPIPPHLSVSRDTPSSTAQVLPPPSSTSTYSSEGADKEDPFTDKGPFSDMTWPRSSSKTKPLLERHSDVSNNSGSGRALGSNVTLGSSQGSEGDFVIRNTPDGPLKSEGVPTRYEQIGDIDNRVGDVSHTLHSSSEPLQRRGTPDKDLFDGPQLYVPIKAPPLSSHSEVLGIGNGSVDRDEKEVLKKLLDGGESTPTLEQDAMHPTHILPQQKSERGILGVPVAPRSKSISRNCANKGEDRPDFGGIGSYLSRMRSLGHRRTASAPIKRVAKSVSCLQQEATEEGEDVFISGTGDGDGSPSKARHQPHYKTETHPPFVVPYLSPMVLRKEVESLISQDGVRILEKEDLVKERPIIYWNLVWYFSRLNLPTYLPLLNLRDFSKKSQDLQKLSMKMQVDLVWDCRFPGVRDPLYLFWLGAVPRPLPLSQPAKNRRDSQSQLQSLVARVQCGDWPPVLTSLLKDRLQGAGPTAEDQLPRSIYRETLFLNMTVSSGHVDIDRFDREYQQHIQRLPKELSTKLHPHDHAPSQRSVHCRRVFGPLRVKE